MADAGMPCNLEEFILDGKIHRFSSRNCKDKSEWYVGFTFPDNHYFCSYGSWLPDIGTHRFLSKDKSHFSDDDVQYMAERAEKIRIDWEAEYQKAGKEAEKVYQSAEYADMSHPYLQKKQIQSYSIKLISDRLVIPVQGFNDKIQSLQYIGPEGQKRFMSGAKVSEGHFIFGDLQKSKNIYVAEGFATSATVYETTGECCICAFSSHNVACVGAWYKNHYPNKSITLAADLGKAGEKAADQWRKRVNDNVVFPSFHGKQREGDSDFNDVFCNPELGMAVLKKCFSKKARVRSVQEIFDKKSKVEWIVPNLFIKGSTNMIYGEAGAGKSCFSMEIAFAISQETPFIFYRPNKARVLYVDGEHSDAELDSRLKSIINRQSSSFSMDASTFRILVSSDFYDDFERDLNLKLKSDRDMIENLMEDFDVVFLDNLSTLTHFSGDAGENDVSAWSDIRDWMRKLKRAGKCVVYVHHANKTGTARGSSILSVEPMTEIRLEKPAHTPEHAEVYAKAIFSKGREIASIRKRPFMLELSDGYWKSFAPSNSPEIV